MTFADKERAKGKPASPGRRDFLTKSAALAASVAIGGDAQTEVDMREIEARIESGHYAELNPEYATNYDEFVKKARDAGYSKPPRVFTNILDNTTPAKIEILGTQDDVAILLVNKQAHRWTEAFVKKYIMHTDAMIQDKVTGGEYSKKGTAGLSHEVLKEFDVLCQKAGVTTKPVLYLWQERKGHLTQAYSFETAEGTPIIELNQFVPNLSKETQVQILAHEIAHHALRHITPKAMVDEHNNPTLLPQGELDADVLAVRITCSPEKRAVALKEIFQPRISQYSQKYPHKNAAELHDIVNPVTVTHPSLNTRLGKLRDMEGKLPAECKSFVAELLSEAPIPDVPGR